MPKVLNWISRFFLGLITLLLMSTWVRWFVDTQAILDQYQVTTETITGINALKSGMGGSALITGIFVILYFFKGGRWLLPVIISTGALLLTRVLSLLFDGFSMVGFIGVVLEILLMAAAAFLWSQRTKSVELV